MEQDQSLDLLVGSPACYHCTTDTPYQKKKKRERERKRERGERRKQGFNNEERERQRERERDRGGGGGGREKEKGFNKEDAKGRWWNRKKESNDSNVPMLLMY